MHEYYDVEEYKKYLVVQAQAALFIFAYHGYLGVQSLWQTVVAVIAVAWITGEIVHVTSMVAGLLGLLLGFACVYITRVHHDRISYHQVFYFIVQPAILYYTLPLYAEQKMYPVGIPLSFLVWLGMNGVMWTFVSHGRRYLLSVLVPIATLFFFSWVLNKHAWLPVSITSGVTVLYMIVMMQYRHKQKLAQQK